MSNPQMELFTQDNDSGKLVSRSPDSSFLSRIWAYEKTILVIFAMVIIGIVSFSLGVEKGRRLAAIKAQPRFDVALKAQEPQPQPVLRQIIRQERYNNLPARTMTEETPESATARAYTIQLASYKTRSYAQREAESLKKKGLSPLILAKGNYIILCVGRFPNKENAQPLLSELKKRYQGCHIRRL